MFLGAALACDADVGSDVGTRRATPVDPSPRTQIVLLGSGTPNADPDRSGPAVAIVVDDVPYLIDLGPGVVRRAAAAQRSGIEGLAVRNLRTAFLTHLHSDHTLGYADFIFTPWVLERDLPAQVYGPKGTMAMTEHLLAAYEEDVRIRIDGLEPANSEGYKVEVHEIEPGLVFEDERVRVTAFLVDHGSWMQAFGFRFETPDQTIVLSGDTRPIERITEYCQGCDVLIHEVYSEAGFQRREPEWQRYHASFHTSTRELSAIAGRARPGLLVLYHQLLWGSTPDELVQEIRRGYDGAVAYGRDLDVF
ncbi:MAG: MBL fold metallo-hydrolase [Gemmatimonadota bacterium]|nr:MAG: MBL fold metallo-hydrolase [Gemmatimonadota bacterium]